MSEVGDMVHYDLVLWLEKGQSPLQQMTPQQRQTVFAALAIIVLLGVVMIFLVSASARMMRRYVRNLSKPLPAVDPLARGDDWAKKAMIEIDETESDSHDSGAGPG